MSFADCIQATEIYDEQPSQLPQQLLSEETQGFDYTILTPEVRVVVWSKTFELKNLMRQSAQDRIEIGQKLIEIKEKLGHGNFRPWLKAEFGWSMRTAARFMQVASQFKCANLAHLDIAASALYLLAEPSTPEEARKEVFELAKEGENITYSKAKAIISRYQKPAQPNASKPDSINAIDTTFAKAKEGNSSTLFESCSSPQNYSQSQALEPKDKGNSMVVTELLVETLTAKECEKRLEPGTIENINSLKKHSEVAAELQPELSNSIRVISIEKN